MRLKEKKYKEKRKEKTGGDVLNGVFLCCLFSHEMFRKGFPTYFFKKMFLLYFSMNYRDFSVKSKLIISLFQTVKLSLSISLFQKNRIFVK